MGTMATHISSLIIVYSSVYPGADQRKYQSSASLAFVWGNHRWPVNYPHKWPVTRKIFPFDFVIMTCLKLRGSHYASQWIKFYNILGKKMRIIFHLWIKLFQAWWRIFTSLNMVFVGLCAKSLAEPVLNYCELDHQEQNSVKKIKHISWVTCILPCYQQNSCHFVLVWMCYLSIAVEAISSHNIFSTLFLRRLTIFLSQALIHHRRYE